ncbi:MAG: glutamyl-tRNA reductase [Planctomycetota bacterium]|jgi:glutamyl-tRNA reductase
MSAPTEFLLIGMSWRTAPADVRGRYALAADKLTERLEAISAIDGVEERFVLSTCNRTEVLVTVAPGKKLEDAVCGILFAGADQNHVYAFRGIQAVIHMFRLTAGLDSMVIGETEILGQVKVAIGTARDCSALGEHLEPLLRQSLTVGKKLRAQTALGQGTLSVARVGVAVAKRVFGQFENVPVLILGAGETAHLVGKHLQAESANSLTFANRTLERAELVAEEFGAKAASLDNLKELVQSADMIVLCLDGAPNLLDLDKFDKRELKHRDRPLLIVDLSIPRVTSEAVADLEGILYYDMDDVSRVLAENQIERKAASDSASSMLVSEVHKYVSQQTYASFSPAINKLRSRFVEVADEVMDDVIGESASPEMMRLAAELSRRLLDVSLSQMKESARHAQPEEALSHEYRQFLDNL